MSLLFKYNWCYISVKRSRNFTTICNVITSTQTQYKSHFIAEKLTNILRLFEAHRPNSRILNIYYFVSICSIFIIFFRCVFVCHVHKMCSTRVCLHQKKPTTFCQSKNLMPFFNSVMHISECVCVSVLVNSFSPLFFWRDLDVEMSSPMEWI